MLEQSWLNESLGRYSELSGPAHFGEAATVGSVVSGFLLNEAEFSGEDVERYINDSLQNEATDLWEGRAEGRALAEAWKSRAEAARKNLDPVGAAESAHNHDAMLEAMGDKYNLGRTDFGDALLTAKRSGKVTLTSETRACAVKLNHDQYLSDSMGADAVSIFGAQVVRDLGTSPRETKSPRLVDFSREVMPSALAALDGAGERQETVSPVRERAKPTPAPAPTPTRGRLNDVRKKFHPAESRVAAQATAAEPEVA